MNTTYGIVFTLLLSFNAQSNDNVALHTKTFIDSYLNGRYQVAANQVFCPALYTDDKKKEKRIKLAGEIEYLAKDFGPVKSYRISKDSSYIVHMLACGPASDYESRKPIGVDILEILHTNGTKSILKLYYILSDNNPNLGIVGIGESGIGVNSIPRLINKHNVLIK